MKHSLWTHWSAILPFARTRNVVQPSGKSTSIRSFDYLEKTAIVTATIRPYQPGQIFFQGSWWRAVCGQDVELPKGTRVCVIGIRTMTHIVEPFV